MATLGEQSVGSIVKLNVNGTPRNFVVAHQGLPGTMYDASCDDTWLVMESVYVKSAWDSSDNDYANSDINNYLNNTFINLFDGAIKDVIKQVKIPYTKGTGKSGILMSGTDGLPVKVFLISHRESALSPSTYTNAEGAALEYFEIAGNSGRAGYFNGAPSNWWLRSPYVSNETNATSIRGAGTGATYSSATNSYGIRPALILPYELNVANDGLIDGTIASAGAITGNVNINGVQRELTGKGYINIGGVLRDLSDSQGDIGGILKSLKG